MHCTLISTQPLNLSTQHRPADEYIMIDPHAPLHDYHHNHIQQAIAQSRHKIIILTNASSLHPHCISEIMLSFESDTAVKLVYNKSGTIYLIAFKKNITLNIPFHYTGDPKDYLTYIESLSTRATVHYCYSAGIT